MGGRGASSDGFKVNGGLQRHFQLENAKVAQLMAGRASNRVGSIEMDNGEILERYTMDFMKKYILKGAKDAGSLPPDEAISILYKDGSIASYGEHDDTSKMKLSNIKGVIYDNPSTLGYAGTGVKIENYNETLAGAKGTRYGTSKDEDDWRIDFE